jgi:hypothetical protein
MRKTIYLVAFLLLVITTAGNTQRTAIMGKVTATWCTQCGQYGWSVMQDLKATYETEGSDALILGVHFSGNLQSDLSAWYASNLEVNGRPQFFVGNERYIVSSNNWSEKIDDIKGGITKFVNDNPFNSEVTLRTYSPVNDNGDFNISVDVSHDGNSAEELYLAIYAFENDVEEVQAGQSGVVNHPNVLRESITDEFFGDLIVSPGDAASSNNYTYTWTPNSDYNVENVGLAVIVYRKVGDTYVMDSSTGRRQWTAQLSSTEQFDNDAFNVINNVNSVDISSSTSGEYNAQLINAQGQLINQTRFTNRTTILTEGLPSGLYILSLSQENKQVSHKLYIN